MNNGYGNGNGNGNGNGLIVINGDTKPLIYGNNNGNKNIGSGNGNGNGNGNLVGSFSYGIRKYWWYLYKYIASNKQFNSYIFYPNFIYCEKSENRRNIIRRVSCRFNSNRF